MAVVTKTGTVVPSLRINSFLTGAEAPKRKASHARVRLKPGIFLA